MWMILHNSHLTCSKGLLVFAWWWSLCNCTSNFFAKLNILCWINVSLKNKTKSIKWFPFKGLSSIHQRLHLLPDIHMIVHTRTLFDHMFMQDLQWNDNWGLDMYYASVYFLYYWPHTFLTDWESRQSWALHCFSAVCVGELPVGDCALILGRVKIGFAELAHAHTRSCMPVIIMMK